MWLGSGVLCGIVAESKKRNLTGWIFAGFFLGPVAVIAVSGMPHLNAYRQLDEEMEQRSEEALRQKKALQSVQSWDEIQDSKSPYLE
jgi:hypothetical protein